MNVEELINISIGRELKQLDVARISATDQDREENITTIIGYINQALDEIHKRFSLIQQSMLLENLVDGATYTMPSTYLYATHAKAVDPDLDEEDYQDIILNDEFTDFTLYTPDNYTVLVHKDNDEYSDITSAYLHYIATCARMVDLQDTIPVGHQYTEALLTHMGMSAHTSMSGLPQGQGSSFSRRFEAACKQIENLGLQTMDNTTNYKAIDRGYP